MQDDSNGEVYFVIRDLKKFQILIEITIFPFFRKIRFSPGFTIDAQKSDVKLQQSVQFVKNGENIDYFIEDEGSLLYKNRLCIPNVQELKKKLMHESHNTVFTMHPGGNKMHQDLK